HTMYLPIWSIRSSATHSTPPRICPNRRCVKSLSRAHNVFRLPDQSRVRERNGRQSPSQAHGQFEPPDKAPVGSRAPRHRRATPRRGAVPQAGLGGGDFLDLAQSLEHQELARLSPSRLTERAQRVNVGLSTVSEGEW